jgi:protein-S-isoprenylcysteine O-methyltransferase Ste14
MTPASSRWSEFRERGGVWVVAQSVLFAGIAAAAVLGPRWPGDAQLPLSIAGGVLTGAGLGFAGWAYRSLGSSFTAYTRPPAGARRVDWGPYRLVRHPMYGGGLLFLVGISLAYGIASLVVTIALALLWRAKSSSEERILVGRFPEYADYRNRTPHRFWPYVY